MISSGYKTLHHKAQGLWLDPNAIWLNPIPSIESLLNTLLEPLYYAWQALKSLGMLFYSILTSDWADIEKLLLDFISYLILSLMTAVTFGLVIFSRSFVTVLTNEPKNNQEDKFTEPVIGIMYGIRPTYQEQKIREYMAAIEAMKEQAEHWSEDIAHINVIQAELYERANIYTQQLEWIHQEFQDNNKEYPNDIYEMGRMIGQFKSNPIQLMQDYTLLKSEYPDVNHLLKDVQSSTEVTLIGQSYQQHHDKVQLFVSENFEKILREIDTLTQQNQRLIDQMQSFEKVERYMTHGGR